MVAGTLYTYPDSFRGFKSQIAAKYSGFNLKVETVESVGDHVKIPAFKSDDKKVHLFEANAIAFYVANDELRGGSSQAEVIQWLEYGSNEVTPSVASWVFPALSLVEFNKNNVNKAKDEVKHVLSVLNEHLKPRTYLVGERLTLADISVAADLLLAYQHVLDANFRETFVNVNRWFETIVNQPNFKSVAGEVKFCEKAAEFSAEKLAQNRAPKPAAAAPAALAEKPKEKKEKKPKEEKPKKEEKKPEPKPEPEAEEEDTEREPESKDPLAALPKGTMNLDEFKRTYSNNEVSVSLPYLWQNFDKENYSFWQCEYLYPDELKQIFMTSNLIGGMFQRIEKLRKHSFASMCVWGEANNNTIAGIWFWKGHELVFPLNPDWTTDYESYKWTKLDSDDEETRKRINQFFSWEGEFNGRKFADGKIFK